MNTKEQINTIDAIQYFFKKDKRALKVWLFGAFARNEQREVDIIEIMVELKPPLIKNSFYELLDMAQRLEELLACRVEMIEMNGIADFSRATYQKEKVKIFG
jgi:predicted nucleotidyltransferase